jgi:hypothetical protein
MVPYIFAMRMMANANANPTPEKPMTCKTPCKKCTCDSVYDSDYIEADPSPDATVQRKWLESPSTFFQRECALRPDSHHCRLN